MRYAAELPGGLHAHCHRHRLPGICAEIAALVVVERTEIDMPVVVVVVVLEPVIVGEFAVGYLALYLHPSVGERYVLEVDETYAHLGDGTRVAALDDVARREAEIEECRFVLLHADGKEHPTVFHLAVELAQAYRRRPLGMAVE